MLDLTVRDGFASEAEVAAALHSWPADGWHEYGAHKRATVPGVPMPGPVAVLLHRMAAFPLGLLPDLGLWGSGLHEMPAGSSGLGWHTDAERHPHLGLSRARSGALYLCGDGDLEFRDGARIAPSPGRLVIFDGAAAHRVGPVTQLRRTITLFWYGGPAPAVSTRASFE